MNRRRAAACLDPSWVSIKSHHTGCWAVDVQCTHGSVGPRPVWVRALCAAAWVGMTVCEPLGVSTAAGMQRRSPAAGGWRRSASAVVGG